MSRFYVVEGQTEPIDVQLLADARPVDLTGTTTTLVLRDKDGTEVDTSGGVITVLDAPTGKLRYSPPASLFDATLSPLCRALARRGYRGEGDLLAEPGGRSLARGALAALARLSAWVSVTTRAAVTVPVMRIPGP
jgi:BppU N-terminal domain